VVVEANSFGRDEAHEGTAMDATPTRKRPWYRLHLSTYVVLLVPLGVLAIVAIPGYPDSLIMNSSLGGSVIFHEHGWPLVHLDRMVLLSSAGWPVDPQLLTEKFPSSSSFRWATPTDTEMVDSPPGLEWLGLSHWKQTGVKVAVHKAALAVNLLMAVTICAVIAGPYEWWRRRRFRYSLRTLLLLFVPAAAVLGWGRWQANQHDREQAVIEQLEKLGCEVTERYCGPVWLARLVGEVHLSILHCADTIDGPSMKNADRQKMLDLAARLPTVTHLSLTGDEHMTDAQWARLGQLKNLEELRLYGGRISDFAVACLAKLPKLRALGFVNLDEADVEKLQKSLPKCAVEDISESG
jgi:hypothetical protein